MNNILQLKYAVEVERTGSISKAAENLYMGQPQLSKAIRELEDSIGIAVFNRTNKGVIPTEKGREFLVYAKSILAQIAEMESLYKPQDKNMQRFDLSAPRASYISFAFTEFIKELDFGKNISLNYRETNSMLAIKNVAENINNLAIIRYQLLYEKYFLTALEERNLKFKPIWDFAYVALMASSHPLAQEKVIDFSDLAEYVEIIHGDISVPALPLSDAREIAKSESKKKSIAIYERGSQFEILSRIPKTYMWVSPMPEDVLKRFSLVQKPCNMSKNRYKDILVYRSNYRFTEEDKLFVQKLADAVQMVSKNI